MQGPPYSQAPAHAPIIQQEELKAYTMQQIGDSHTLGQSELVESNKKKILDDLRKELE